MDFSNISKSQNVVVAVVVAGRWEEVVLMASEWAQDMAGVIRVVMVLGTLHMEDLATWGMGMEDLLAVTISNQ